MSGQHSSAAEQTVFDVAVVGAGPAGLGAAAAAARAGVRVVLIDAGHQLGGQYWRHPDESTTDPTRLAGYRHWGEFLALRERILRHCQTGAAVHLASTHVWFVEPPAAGGGRQSWTLHLMPGGPPSRETPPRTVCAERLILCPGAYDRQLPIPGWDLPGVMAAGGVQALLKGHHTLSGRRAVVAGTGPFLLPVAQQLARHGVDVLAVCEANGLARWMRHMPVVARTPAKVSEAATYAWSLARARIPYRTATVLTRIDPDASGTQVGAVELARVGPGGLVEKARQRLEVDLVALGWGFTPSLELINAVGAQTRIDADQSLVAVVDDDQQSTVPGVFIAGEATGVGGAMLALAGGELAGIVAAEAGHLERARVRALRREIGRLRAFAAAMHDAHPVPARWPQWLTAETLVCRCEEVAYATLGNAITELGANDARTLKLLTRCAMGWCQGHVCGYASASLAAGGQGRALTADDLRPLAKQFPCAPVPLAHLAGE